MSAQLKPSRTEAFGGCPHDCPDTCSWIVSTDNGRAVGLEDYGKPTAYVCRGYACRAPVTGVEALAEALSEAS